MAIPRHITLPSATVLVIGSVIGSGIFLTSGLMMNQLATGGELMLMWVVGGLLSLCGCFVYAELGAMLPRSGGLYVYLEEAYGPAAGYLFGWTVFIVMLTGQIASVALGFAAYLAYFTPALGTDRLIFEVPLGSLATWRVSAAQGIAAISIVALGLLNMRRLEGSRSVAVQLTVVKCVAMLALAVMIFAFADRLPDVSWSIRWDAELLPVFGLALIPVLYTYEGWSYLAFSAGEVRDPATTLPRAYLLGMAGVAALYLLMNLAYVAALPAETMRGVQRIGEAAATQAVGSIGGTLLSAVALLSTLGCNAAMIFGSARVLHAMAERGHTFAGLAAVHPRRRTPHKAVLAITSWSAVLALSGTYEQLYTFVTFGTLLFAVAGGLALFVLRSKLPDLPRPYRAAAYPWLPLFFVLAMAALAINTLVEKPTESLVGLALIVAGLPLYFYLQRKDRADRTT
jgi:basic amino acid/polyamine antiporter, APA family